MSKVTIYTDNNDFILHFQDIKLTNFFIHDKEKGRQLTFEQVGSNKYKIAAIELINLAQQLNSEKLHIYSNNTNEEDESEFFIHEELQVEFSNHAFVDINGYRVTIYISLDKALRFIIDNPPSAKCYFKEVATLITKTADNEFIINTDIITEYVPLQSINAILKNRKNKKEFINTVTINKVSKGNGNEYINNVDFVFSTDNFISLTDEISLNKYETSVMDIWFQFNFEIGPVSSYRFRLPLIPQKTDENWLKYDNDYMMLLKTYPTLGLNNLSIRIIYLKNDVYKHYQTIKQENHFAKHKKSNPKKILLITENDLKAQENGLQFFKYMIKNHSDTFKTYYVISEDSKDIANLMPYKDNIILFKSMEHLKLMLDVDVIAHTHSTNYAYPLVTDYLQSHYNHINKVFIQHGIIGVRNLSKLYGKKYNPTFTNKFIVSSEREKQHVHEILEYDLEEIHITGLARFDQLLQSKSKFKRFSARKRVLIMPTWREQLRDLSNEKFMETTYYKEYQALINDSSFLRLAKQKKLEVNFYLHSNFQKFSPLFHSNFVNVIFEGQYTVQELLQRHGILITDYSSVGLDFALLRRPVLYYQMDATADVEIANSRGFLPGPIFNEKNQLLKYLRKKVRSNKIDASYESFIKDNLYSYSDKKAGERIYNVINSFFDKTKT
ncbi:CDP-glycerol glycerophosphotransferase family protein [Alkalihalobacillus pseudalcaliphilus]|uniref:CDP-glycerol glycerophosphotransferase family protein n=1 Tax=Alkalihalobacillus pseudalcaliphilus TaxID=79884 RepID=UPI00064D8A48|nr:CDP-glycerol glycerophosphotransferase family protein [Alkalihalobacillus pseudalcaliphilus]KMK77405.1 hypothetical protein AB990_02710 [Alkalihalobacillus pseudalcaliphilus]